MSEYNKPQKYNNRYGKLEKCIICIIALVVFIDLCLYFYNNVIVKSYRYSSPTESFNHSNLKNTDLIDIIEIDDIAMVICQNQAKTFSSYIISKEDNGWTPLSLVYDNVNHITLSDGWINVTKVDAKYVVTVEMMIDYDATIPIISDSNGSNFIVNDSLYIHTYIQQKFIYGLLVYDQELPDDYAIIFNDETISIK